MRHRTFLYSVFSAAVMTTVLSGCGEQKPSPAAGGAGEGMPPVEVGVVTVTPGQLALTSELPGRLEALRTAEVRARVAGTVFERAFREGSDVKAGDLLYRIDPRPYEAQLANARSELARAEAELVEARQRETRARSLIGKSMISQQDFDAAIALAKASEADVAAKKATVELHRLNVNLASVRAPISGRIGRALVTEGALVGQGEVTPLAVI
ncbi:MAG TPA: efflux RND transporter periplasmic adaptor subunit, partial [Candidatus Kapabacteria bacterium]|nr:efflux RND transporter periplasmic adaptor subunit [Candidatus Kapabacteria bacterium]